MKSASGPHAARGLDSTAIFSSLNIKTKPRNNEKGQNLLSIALQFLAEIQFFLVLGNLSQIPPENACC